MEKEKRSWVLRPIAWVATVVMVYCVDLISKLVCKIGAWAVGEFSSLSTGMVILLTILFGSVYISLYFYSAFILPTFLVSASDTIYPSNHAFRYYFVGIVTIILCVITVIGTIRGWIIPGNGTSKFWLYASCAHTAISMIVTMVHGHSSAEERHK